MSFILLAEPLTDEGGGEGGGRGRGGERDGGWGEGSGRGRKPDLPEKTPDDELQKEPHTKARQFTPQPRLEPALEHWWQVLLLGKQTC